MSIILMAVHMLIRRHLPTLPLLFAPNGYSSFFKVLQLHELSGKSSKKLLAYNLTLNTSHTHRSVRVQSWQSVSQTCLDLNVFLEHCPSVHNSCAQFGIACTDKCPRLPYNSANLENIHTNFSNLCSNLSMCFCMADQTAKKDIARSVNVMWQVLFQRKGVQCQTIKIIPISTARNMKHFSKQCRMVPHNKSSAKQDNLQNAKLYATPWLTNNITK